MSTASNHPGSVDADDDDLWREYRRTRSDAARNAIAERYRPFLTKIAKDVIRRRQLPRYIEVTDLAAEGFFGLVQAIERFDPSRGLKFGTYAQLRIRGAMIDSVRCDDWLPRHIRHRNTVRERAADRLTVRHGRPPAPGELRSELLRADPDPGRVDKVMRADQQSVFTFSGIESRRCGDREYRHRDVLNLRDPHDPFAAVDNWDDIEFLMSKLTLRERFVLCLYFGGVTQEQIGHRLGRSEALVSSVRRRVVERLKAEVSAA